MKTKIKTPKLLPHVLVFLFFFTFFYFFLHRGALIFGDLASSFLYRDGYFTVFPQSWSSADFLGYETSFYTLSRASYYLFQNMILAVFGHKMYYLFFVFIYFIRYFTFYILIKDSKEDTIKNVLIAFSYSVGIFFLDHFGHTFITFSMSFFPLLFHSYRKIIDEGRYKYIFPFFLSVFCVLSSFHVSLLAAYFFSIYVASRFFLIDNGNRRNFVYRNVMLLVLITLTFSYIVFPFFYRLVISPKGNLIDQVSSQTSGAVYTYNSFSGLINTFVGGGFYNSYFIGYKYLIYIMFFLLVPVFSILLNRRVGEKKDVIVLFALLFSFWFLGSYPLVGDFIPSLKKYLLGFDSIKDLSYFGMMIGFLVFLLLSRLVKYRQKNEHIIYLAFLAGYSVFLNLFIFIKKNEYKTVNIPASYQELIDEFRPKGRVALLPFSWVAKSDWSQDVIMSGFFNRFFAKYDKVGQLIIEGPSKSVQDKIKALQICFRTMCSDLDGYMDELNISNVLAFNKYDRRLLARSIGGSRKFRTVKETDDYILLERDKEVFPKIYSLTVNLSVNQINPTEYHVDVEKTSDPFELIFLDSFSEEWKIFKRNDSSKLPLSLSYILSKPLYDSSHGTRFGFANAWMIDGDYEENLILIHYPQLFINLGLLVSAISIFVCCLYVILVKRTFYESIGCVRCKSKFR